MFVPLSLVVLKKWPVSNMQGSKALKNAKAIDVKECGSLKRHMEESHKPANQEHLQRTVTSEQNTNLHLLSHWNSGVFIT